MSSVAPSPVLASPPPSSLSSSNSSSSLHSLAFEKLALLRDAALETHTNKINETQASVDTTPVDDVSFSSEVPVLNPKVDLTQLNLHTSPAQGEQRTIVKVGNPLWKRPSPVLRSRHHGAHGHASPTLFPKFHYTPSLGLGVGQFVTDNNSQSVSNYYEGSKYDFMMSPELATKSIIDKQIQQLKQAEQAREKDEKEKRKEKDGDKSPMNPLSDSFPSSSNDSSPASIDTSLASRSSGTWDFTPLQQQHDFNNSTAATIATSVVYTSTNSSHALSQFSTLPGDSASVAVSSTAESTAAAQPPQLHINSTDSPQLHSNSPGDGVRRLAEQFLNSLLDDENSPSNAQLRRLGKSMKLPPNALAASADAKQTNSQFVPTLPQMSASAAEIVASSTLTGDDAEFLQLHLDILEFGRLCELDTQQQSKLREELVQRTRWSIRCVYPTAEVDLVGSVAAGVALPKSDLDFVIYFPPSSTPPPSYSYAAPNNSQPNTAVNYTYTAPVITDSPDGGAPTQLRHFAHAGSLIKLIGGRKKSKSLFRSTKIQVFKDINLIRLRDGMSGISIDLWFPVDPVMLTRSQQHTELIRSYLTAFPTTFYALACVMKTFMQQNLLNSGYSGLGSYGILLMLIRYLQHERQQAKLENRLEEQNVGRLLVGFFKCYATFDYVNQAIDVSGEGGFIPKPAVVIIKRVRKLNTTKMVSPTRPNAKKKRGDDDDDDDDDFDDWRNEMDLDHEDEYEDEPSSLQASEERESASLRKKRTLSSDRYTLLIIDPQDPLNQIICHHKALRNMVVAFIRALTILDPNTPPPPLTLPPAPVAVTMPDGTIQLQDPDPSQELELQASLQKEMSKFPPQQILPIPTGARPVQAENNPNLTRFHRLIDVEAGRTGPSMKPCPSEQCGRPDGTSLTYCPIQNKVCFTCGYMFVRSDKKGEDSKASAPNTPPLGAVNAPSNTNSTVNAASTATQARHRKGNLNRQEKHANNQHAQTNNHGFSNKMTKSNSNQNLSNGFQASNGHSIDKSNSNASLVHSMSKHSSSQSNAPPALQSHNKPPLFNHPSVAPINNSTSAASSTFVPSSNSNVSYIPVISYGFAPVPNNMLNQYTGNFNSDSKSNDSVSSSQVSSNNSNFPMNMNMLPTMIMPMNQLNMLPLMNSMMMSYQNNENSNATNNNMYNQGFNGMNDSSSNSSFNSINSHSNHDEYSLSGDSNSRYGVHGDNRHGMNNPRRSPHSHSHSNSHGHSQHSNGHSHGAHNSHHHSARDRSYMRGNHTPNKGMYANHAHPNPNFNSYKFQAPHQQANRTH